MLGAFADAEAEAALERLCRGEEEEGGPGGSWEQGVWRQRLKLQEAVILSSKGTSFLVSKICSWIGLEQSSPFVLTQYDGGLHTMYSLLFK